LAYESPTWFRLTDELQQGVSTRSLNNQDGIEFPFSYQNSVVYLPYRIQTPGKWTGSLSYIFGKKGLISADVSTKNYSALRFKPKNDPGFADLNNFMSNALDNAIEVRIGGEYRIKQVSLRAGYRFEESPYKVDQAFGDLTGYSGGIGYNFGESRIDLAYSYDHRNSNQALISSGMTDTARVSRYNNNITFSYSVNF
jgi:predicted porin